MSKKLIDTTKLSSFKTKLINDTTPTTNTTYSSTSINTKLSTLQDTLTPGTNITIEKINNSTVISSNSSSTQVKIGDVTNPSVSSYKRTVSLTWNDPADIVVSGVTLAEWAGTKVVRKVGSAPTGINDGTLVVDNIVRNAYSSTALTDNNLEYGTIYYYRFFTYMANGLVTNGSTVSVTPTRVALSTVPSQSGTLTYNGNEQSPSWSNYNSSELDISGNIGTNAGSYTATFTPKEDYRWSDDSEYKSANWSIGKATGSFTLNKSSVTLNSSAGSATVTATVTGDGSVTAVSSDTSVATVTKNGNTFTINNVNETNGSATITFSLAATSNYTAGSSATVDVTASFLVPKSWDTATDAEIVAMVAAADAGELDLSQYWAVGQSRNVKIGAIEANSSLSFTAMPEQTVEMVLMNEGYPIKSGTQFVNQSGIHFVVGTKDCLSRGDYDGGAKMNLTNTNVGTWRDCVMREVLNTLFYNAITSYDNTTDKNENDVKFRSIFKSFTVATADTADNNANIQTVTDKIALFALKEVGIESSTSEASTERSALKVIEYYKTSSNRTKHRGINSIVECTWWLRSPVAASSSNMYFNYIMGNGSNYFGNPSAGNYMAPFGCI